MSKDQVFCVRENGVEVWKCVVAGEVYGDWTSKGPALAGLATEQARAAKRAAKSGG